MEEDISVSEYRRLLVGLMEDTPLGRVVEIRSTTDRERLKNMTVHEKKIRADWARFKREKQKQYRNPNEIQISSEQLKNLFISFAKG